MFSLKTSITKIFIWAFLKKIYSLINPPKDSDNGILGLAFLQEYTRPIPKPSGLRKTEWRRKLVSSTGGEIFIVKYFSELKEGAGYPIQDVGMKPAKVIAEDIDTGEQILLFDLGKHGYSAMFSFTYSTEELSNRNTTNEFQLKSDEKELELYISADYSFNYQYDDEFTENLNEEGKIKLNSGEWLDWEIAKETDADQYIFGLTLMANRSIF